MKNSQEIARTERTEKSRKERLGNQDKGLMKRKAAVAERRRVATCKRTR